MKSELTVEENPVFWRRYLGNADGGTGMSIEDAADAVGLPGITHLPFGYLSAGQQRRFAFKLLVSHRSCLDPTNRPPRSTPAPTSSSPG